MLDHAYFLLSDCTQEVPVVLVHIPNELFPFFVQPLFRILFGKRHDGESSEVAWTDRNEFLTLSITPAGSSLICSKVLVEKCLTPLVKEFNAHVERPKANSAGIEISQDEYVAIQVDGQGLDAGQRVLELTAPLAMAGMYVHAVSSHSRVVTSSTGVHSADWHNRSIFFLTTYFSDYVLVPVRARRTVVTTLQQRGFVFSAEAEAYVSQLSPMVHHNYSFNSPSCERPQTASSSSSESRPHSSSMPSTPPAEDIPELQIRTFTKLMKNGIEPTVDTTLRLFSCAGSRECDGGSVRQLKEDLMQVLLASNAPNPAKHKSSGPTLQDIDVTHDLDYAARFLSMTLSSEPVSILMEEHLLPRLGKTLFGAKAEEDALVPIMFDLHALGWTATGIVGGVASRLSQGPMSDQLDEEDVELVEISFLSSAKAGSVIVQARQLKKALRALEMGIEEVEGRR